MESSTSTSFFLNKPSSAYSSPCAGCKFLRRKCQADCVFAPYFPPDQPQKFANVHRIFGASNVTKILIDLEPYQREDAVNSLAYEAEMRLRDPINGCVGVISLYHRQLQELQRELSFARSELAKYQSGHVSGVVHSVGGGMGGGIGYGRDLNRHYGPMLVRNYNQMEDGGYMSTVTNPSAASVELFGGQLVKRDATGSNELQGSGMST